ncbi:Mobile element protein [Methanosarcina mazei Tuc01]|uniref:Mobile element protein n=1 Tax=Methanosarcina mazei Tuc01 TaxID=1236903 RepID=M1QHA4_METMZ|nr:Mobile element protein [Methanosarcina mazei Tuc01]
MKEMEKMGLFILASNDISLSPEEMLKYYKGQDNVEKGFRFLKSDTFSISKVYLKKKGRIEAFRNIEYGGYSLEDTEAHGRKI